MRVPYGFFLLVFLLGSLAQNMVWRSTRFTDEEQWIMRVTQLHDDLAAGKHFDQEHYSEHPGMPVLLIAAAAQGLTFSTPASLRVGVILLNAFSVAGIASYARLLRPTIPWWLAAAGLLLLHPLYYQASPTDAVIAPLFVLIFLLILWHWEQRSSTAVSVSLLLGFSIGLALAIRLHVTTLSLLPWFLSLLLAVGLKRVSIILVSTLTGTFALNPLLWYTPAQFLFAATIGQVGFFSGTALAVTYQITVYDFLLFAPLALVSFMLALASLFQLPAHSAVCRQFILTMLICTVVICFALMYSALTSLRYLFPLIFLWEAFLPLWLLQALAIFSDSYRKNMLKPFAYFAAQHSIVLLLIGINLFLFLYD